jgi:hypothetical protein
LELPSSTSASDKEVSGETTIPIEIGEESDKIGSLRGWRNGNRNKPRAITGYGIVEDEKEKAKENKKGEPGSSKLGKNAEEGGVKSKQLKLQNKSDFKIKDEKIEEWSFGKWMRIALIVLIVLAILIFLFFQVVQITKGFEKN